VRARSQTINGKTLVLFRSKAAHETGSSTDIRRSSRFCRQPFRSRLSSLAGHNGCTLSHHRDPATPIGRHMPRHQECGGLEAAIHHHVAAKLHRRCGREDRPGDYSQWLGLMNATLTPFSRRAAHDAARRQSRSRLYRPDGASSLCPAAACFHRNVCHLMPAMATCCRLNMGMASASRRGPE